MTVKPNAQELALIAQAMGAEVIRGPVGYPGHLADIEVMLVVSPVGPVEELPMICGLCGTPYQGNERPTCKTERQDAGRVIEERLRKHREEKDRLIGDLEDWLATQAL